MKSPLFEPVMRARATTLSPFSMTSSASKRISGKPAINMAKSSLVPALVGATPAPVSCSTKSSALVRGRRSKYLVGYVRCPPGAPIRAGPTCIKAERSSQDSGCSGSTAAPRRCALERGSSALNRWCAAGKGALLSEPNDDQCDRPEQCRGQGVHNWPRRVCRDGVGVAPQVPYRGGDRAGRVAVCDYLQPTRHVECRHERVRDESDRENDDKTNGHSRLRFFGQKAQAGRRPGERIAENRATPNPARMDHIWASARQPTASPVSATIKEHRAAESKSTRCGPPAPRSATWAVFGTARPCLWRGPSPGRPLYPSRK
jgi:hypothetical protein